MNYFKVEVNNRYGYVQAYITSIGLYERDSNQLVYKVISIVAGINIPERVGRNTYKYQDDAVTDLLQAQKLCIKKVFKLK